MSESLVTIQQNERAEYPLAAPYHPARRYPETSALSGVDASNGVYDMVRESFHALGYDASNFGAKDWNPLGWLIKPGETVFIKPNMISHKHTHNEDWEYVITHGSVIRAVIDYVCIALQYKGKVIIGDGPQTDSHFEKIIDHMGLMAIAGVFSTIDALTIEIVDLRNEHWIEMDGIYTDVVKLKGDPNGWSAVDLGKASMFSGNEGRQFYGAYYDVVETNSHHSGGKHEYAVSNSPLKADVFINIPKLKTHKKCGLTVNLKSLVGINANKNWLPHYRFGAPKSGGDQFDHEGMQQGLENLLVRKAKDWILTRTPAIKQLARMTKHLAYKVFGSNDEVVRSGNWHGNDTVWRMCLDLNRILFYGDGKGGMRPSSPKKYFSVVDGIVAMEGNGPVGGTPRNAGVLIAGENPVAVDAVCAKLIGFDYRKIELLRAGFEKHEFPLANFAHEEIVVTSSNPAWSGPLAAMRNEATLKFVPHFGWKGHVEL